MSLTSFVELPDVAERLNALLLETPKLGRLATRAEPLTRNYSTVGTALDYAIRFELERRCPHALLRTWIAEEALERIWMALLGEPERIVRARTQECRDAVEQARRFHATFVSSPAPCSSDWTRLAEHTLRLATLDVVYRAQRLFPLEPSERDVADVLALLDLVPWEHLVHASTMWLNPTFGTLSELVGGADADVISGTTLIEIKTRKHPAIARKDLRQLVGYLILAGRVREEVTGFPEIGTLAIYLARQAHVWSVPATVVTGRAPYRETEEWFISRAREEESRERTRAHSIRIRIGPAMSTRSGAARRAPGKTG